MARNSKRTRPNLVAFREVFSEAFSTIAEMVAPAVLLGGAGFVVLVVVELILPGNQIAWLESALREGWGFLVFFNWLLLLTVLWQAASILGQRGTIESTDRRLRKLQGDDD